MLCILKISPRLIIQGLINAMVFLRPKYVKYRKDNPGRSLCSIMRHTVFGVDKNSSFVGGKNSIVTMFKSSNKSGVEKSVIDDELLKVEENNDKDNKNDGLVVEDEAERRTSIQWKDEENGFEEEKVEEAAEDIEEAAASSSQVSSSPAKSLIKGSFTETSTKLG